MRKRRFAKKKTPLYFRHIKDGLFLMFFLRERFSQNMYPKRRFWVHIAADMYPKRRFWIHIAADMYPKSRFWIHIAGVLWF